MNLRSSLLLDMLESVAASLGIVVRYEQLVESDDSGRVSSGMCRLRDSRILLVDSRLGPDSRIQVLASVLARFDLDDVFLPPAVREIIERSGD